MTFNKDIFIQSFLDELEENIFSVDSGILKLKKDPDNVDELNIILRALHTIKGSSRMLKFNTVEEIAHGLENVFKGIKDERYTISKSLIQLVFITTDYFRECAQQIEDNKDDSVDVKKLIIVFEKAYSNESYSLDHLRLKELKTFMPLKGHSSSSDDNTLDDSTSDNQSSKLDSKRDDSIENDTDDAEEVVVHGRKFFDRRHERDSALIR